MKFLPDGGFEVEYLIAGSKNLSGQLSFFKNINSVGYIVGHHSKLLLQQNLRYLTLQLLDVTNNYRLP